MRRKWDNIFTNQRIGSQNTHQLENNTTKNLLKVLKDTDPVGMEAFLTQSFATFPPLNQFESDAFTVETQVGIDTADFTDRETYLLGISRRGQDVVADGSSSETSSIIDGLVHVDTDNHAITVGIEVKTHDDTLNADQMAKYKHELAIRDPTHINSLRWRAVYGLLLDLADDHGFSTKDQYLYQEYTDYLEYEQLSTIVAEHDGNPRKRLRLRR